MMDCKDCKFCKVVDGEWKLSCTLFTYVESECTQKVIAYRLGQIVRIIENRNSKEDPADWWKPKKQDEDEDDA